MPYPTVIHLVAAEFGQSNIRCILIGGFAVNFHGVSRQTADVDFLLTDTDYAEAVAILQKFGYRELHRHHTCARLTCSNIMFMDVDFVFVGEDTFAKVWDKAHVSVVEGQTVRLPCLDHLIGMKLHALKNNPGRHGDKDLLDILALVRENNLDVDSQQFRALCLRFGTEELFTQIRRRVSR